MLGVMMTDGRRDCIERSVASLVQNVHGLDEFCIVDDSGDAAYRAWLVDRFADSARVIGDGPRVGYARAVQRAWSVITRMRRAHAFVTEDDFTYERHVWLGDLAQLLDDRTYLVQVALRRQPWFAAEVEAGGVLERFDADAYVECTDRLLLHDAAAHRRWIEHRLFWTQNPHVLRRPVVELGWPTGRHSERRFADRLRRTPGTRFAYWGGLDDPPWVTHIGDQRNGEGY